MGPVLEMIECLKVLERDEKRSEVLEDTVVDMAAMIFEANGRAKKGWVKTCSRSLDSGKALKKFWDIAKAQGAKKEKKSSELKLGHLEHKVKSVKSGTIKNICTREIVEVARSLGTPKIKEAGIYFEKMPGDRVEKGDVLMTLYATSKDRMEDGIKAVDLGKLFEI